MNQAANTKTMVFSALVLLMMFGALGALVFWQEEQLASQEKHNVLLRLAGSGAALSTAATTRITLMNGLKTFVDSKPEDAVLSAEFEAYARILYASTPGVRIIAYAPGGVVRHVYPARGNEAALGHDLLKDNSVPVKKYVDQALATQSVTLSVPYQLRQGGMGAILRQVVYRADGNLRGLIAIGFDVLPLLDEAGLAENIEHLQVAIRDQGGNIFFGQPGVFMADPVIAPAYLGGKGLGEWEIAAVPQGGWREISRRQIWLFRGLIAGMGSLLLAFFYREIRRKQHLKKLVIAKTKELQQERNTMMGHVLVARKIQTGFLPQEINNDYLSVKYIYEAYEQVSGDLLDFTWDEERAILRGFILDITGHGVATSLQASALHALLNRFPREGGTFCDKMHRVNQEALRYLSAESLAAVIYFELDLRQRQITIVAAGINHYLASSLPGHQGKIPGSFLGINDQPEYEQQILPVAPGDTFYFLSDGLMELLKEPQQIPVDDFLRSYQWLKTEAVSEKRWDDASGICIQIKQIK